MSTVLTPPRPETAPVLRRLAPGLLLAGAVAIAAALLAPVIGGALRAIGVAYTLPSIVIALAIGIALHGLVPREPVEAGLTWCVKTLLRIAIALLGLRIALADVAAIGLAPALLVVVSMAATLASGVLLARALALSDGYGALAGAATAVCGASATLATATVVPNYPAKGADVAFTVVAANAISTLVMVLYPPLCVLLGLDATATGTLLGATIHDMAQVVGAGYAVSEPVGNTAVVVKLFRVLLLLPVVLAVGWWLAARQPAEAGGLRRASVPVPVFALAFIGLCLLNSLISLWPAAQPLYQPVRAALVQASGIGLLVAIAALGLNTSMGALLAIGWRHILVFSGATLVLLALVAAGLLLIS